MFPAQLRIVCPSHVLPLTEPGAVWATLKGMLRPNSPFSVKLRPDWRLAQWFLRFALRCNEKDMMTGARALYPLLRSSMNLYREMLAREGIDCEWTDKDSSTSTRTGKPSSRSQRPTTC